MENAVLSVAVLTGFVTVGVIGAIRWMGGKSIEIDGRLHKDLANTEGRIKLFRAQRAHLFGDKERAEQDLAQHRRGIPPEICEECGICERFEKIILERAESILHLDEELEYLEEECVKLRTELGLE